MRCDGVGTSRWVESSAERLPARRDGWWWWWESKIEITDTRWVRGSIGNERGVGKWGLGWVFLFFDECFYDLSASAYSIINNFPITFFLVFYFLVYSLFYFSVSCDLLFMLVCGFSVYVFFFSV